MKVFGVPEDFFSFTEDFDALLSILCDQGFLMGAQNFYFGAEKKFLVAGIFWGADESFLN